MPFLTELAEEFEVAASEPVPSSFDEATSLYNEARLCVTTEETITVPSLLKPSVQSHR